MKLSKILERLEYTCLQGTLDQEIEEVVADSRKAKEGSFLSVSVVLLWMVIHLQKE